MVDRFRSRGLLITVFGMLSYLLLNDMCMAQLNRPPEFLPDGDMSWLAIKEDLPIGSSVYTLNAVERNGSRVTYDIISDYFDVDKHSGVVTLSSSLDREDQDILDVVIKVIDEKVADTAINSFEVKRQVTILDVNDNVPKFSNITYSLSIEENTPLGIVVSDDLIVTDADIGANAEITLQCLSTVSPFSCERFEIETKELSTGRYQGLIRLKKPLDYEETSMYILPISAEDSSPHNRQSINLVVDIIDLQDQPPTFINSPYFLKIQENETESNKSLMVIDVYDGDRGKPRPLDLKLIDPENYFYVSITNTSDLRYVINIFTSENIFNKVYGIVNKHGGFYTFFIKATEVENGHLTSVYSETSITVLSTDLTGIQPKWSIEECNITIFNDIVFHSNLEGCVMFVSGNGKNKFYINSSDESSEIFEVRPQEAKGTTQVFIYVNNATVMNIENIDRYQFQIIAVNENGFSSAVNVTVNKANYIENSFSFEYQHYVVNISEAAVPGTFITEIIIENSLNSPRQFIYSLEGFGSHRFNVNSDTGSISLKDCESNVEECDTFLDFESVSEYFFVYIASDSYRNRVVTNLSIIIIDANDNSPIFINPKAVFHVSLKADKFDPPLKLQAIDLDSSYCGNNNITYKITQVTPSSEAFVIDNSGEITLNFGLFNYNSSFDKSFTIHVVANDMGTPPLVADTFVIIHIEDEVEASFYFAHSLYNATVFETDLKGKDILQVNVVDPISQYKNIIYRIISGAMDNFDVDSRTGIIKIAENSILDLEISPNYYQLQLEAVYIDNQNNKSATTAVGIRIQDVNDKPPKFLQNYYLRYLPEGIAIGDDILTVKAYDPDVDSVVRYNFNRVVSARDIHSLILPETALHNLRSTFIVNALNGTVSLENEFDRSLFSSICISIDAKDTNVMEGGEQSDSVEIILIIKSTENFSPLFPLPWTPNSPKFFFNIPEEVPIGSKLFTLTAKAFHGFSNISYEKLNDENIYFAVDELSGVVTITQRLDFEMLPKDDKSVQFVVKALNNKNGEKHSSTATVIIDITDINDNSPVFLNDSYWRMIPESTVFPDSILTVSALDQDQQFGFGDIRYVLTGDSDTFDIDSDTGSIVIANGKHLDREKKAVYNLKATAIDNPNSTENHRQSSVLIVIELLDVNDNFPKFTEPLYQAIFSETCAPEFIIRNIQATDADLGNNGLVRYSLNEDSELKDFISINKTSGSLFVKKALSGKGQSEPYKVIVTASDEGDPPLSSDVHVLLFITDDSTNDGVPIVVKNGNGNVVNLPENSPPGTIVTTLEVDDFHTEKFENGLLRFSFLGDGGPESDEKHFAIDSTKGIISSRYPLDREIQSNYTIVIMVKDLENPPNHNSLILTVNIEDVDDHFPAFQRSKNSHAIMMNVVEEVSLNTVIGYVEAVDKDVGKFASIDYSIVSILPSNETNLFEIKRTSDNKGLVYVNGRVDCETKNTYVLTVHAKRWNPDFRKGKYYLNTNSDLLLDFEVEKEKPIQYDPLVLNLVQIQINVEDIDDHEPYFIHGNITTWMKSDTKPGDIVFTFIAKDDDFTKNAVEYKLISTQFSNLELSDSTSTFKLDKRSGILRLWRSVNIYENGYFEILAQAESNNKTAMCRLTLYVTQSKQLLKFVFNKAKGEVNKDLPDFKIGLQESFLKESAVYADFLEVPFANQELSTNISSVCFQFLNENLQSNANSGESLLDLLNNPILDTIYDKYGVEKVEKCEANGSLYTMSWVNITILVIAALIVLISTISCLIMCYLYKRYH